VTRRERTTGLPRARRTERHETSRRFAGLPVNDRTIHVAVISAIGALVAIVVVLIGLNWYHENIGHGREVILRVGSQQFTLKYYSDRLYAFVTTNQGEVISYETALMDQLEHEGLVMERAQELGKVPDGAAIDQQIGLDVGVAPDTAGFDNAVRAQLDLLQMSLKTYRRMQQAKAAEASLLADARTSIPDSGELVQLRIVVTSTREQAQIARSRIEAGEDMGIVATEMSTDLDTQPQAGLRSPEPEKLLPEEVEVAVTGKPAGTLSEPIEISDSEFWVVRVESRSQGTHTDEHKDGLAAEQLTSDLEDVRARVQPVRSADSGDFEWAAERAF
jgi:hypothetical protein